MNILRIALVLLTGLGFSFGFDKLADPPMYQEEYENNYGHMGTSGCYRDDEFLDHMIELLSEEEALLVQNKIEELLVKYDITLEELEDNYEIRYDFMDELMDFFVESDINVHNHFESNYNYQGHMGMH